MFENLFSERGLSFDRLKVLIEVHDAGSIAQDAPGDSVRQSQYSRQLRELSEFFGCEVARRRGRLLKLTAQGERLADLAREHLRALGDFRAECRAESVDYTIAAGDSLLQWLVIPRLGAFATRKQTARFATVNLRTKDIVQQLIEGRIDFGIIRDDAVTNELKSAPLGELTFVAVVPAALVKTSRKPTLKEIFAELPVAAQTTDGQFTQRLREIAAELKVEFRPSLACQSFPQTMSAARSGAFVAFVPKLALTELSEKSHLIVDAEPLKKLRRRLVLAWSPRVVSVRPGAARLLEQLQRMLKIS
jgi:DNA-binding transcriptional LysR family regulator